MGKIHFRILLLLCITTVLVIGGELKAQENNPIFQIAPRLVDPDATEETRELYEFLKLQFRHRIISGQTHSYYNAVIPIAGQSPLLRAGDFQHFTEGYAYLWRDGGHTFGKHDDGSVDQLISWYNQTGKKGIVSYQWHWHSPTGGDPGTNTFYTNQTSFDITRALTPGTSEYNDVIRDMDDIAVELQRFQDAGIPVLWRPLHEAGGGWFWWGAGGADACKALYDMMFDRFLNHHGLHNLIWVWSTPETEWYPGNDKVDIIGHDSYPGEFNYTNQKYSFDRLFDLTGGEKLIAMTENGPIPDPDECLQEGAPWLFFMSWSDLVTEQNSTQHIKDVFNHSQVLTVRSGIPRTDPGWRSSLYPEEWKPGFEDQEGRFLHDFSHAGYRGGGPFVPDISGPVVNVTEPPYLADPTGVEDVTQLLQQALDDVGASGGGVVFLPAGTYRIKTAPGATNCLTISHNSTVLRGAGSDSTLLFHDETQMRQKNIIYVSGGYAGWFVARGQTTYLRADLEKPTRILPVLSTSGFVQGDQVIVTATPTEAFMREHGMDGLWTEQAIKGVAFKRIIDSIDHSRNLLILDAPTRYPLTTRDSARIYHAGTHLRESGIEHLSIGNREHEGSGWEDESYLTAGSGAYDVHFCQAIRFDYSENCWVRQVKTYKPEGNTQDVHLLSNGILLNQCRFITIDSCDFQKPQYEGGGGNGYMYTLQSNDCLIQNSRANHSRHNYDFKYPFSNGNVIFRCRGEHSRYSSDFHMYLSMANLFDQFTVNGDYLESMFRPYGGNAIHGYSSTQSVFYNTVGEQYHPARDYIIDSRQFQWGYIIGTSGPAFKVQTDPVSGNMNGFAFDTAPRDFVEGSGEGTFLEPSSLFMDQLNRRLLDSVNMHLYDVEIEVVDAKSGAVIPGSEVMVYDRIQQTDESGRTLFEQVPETFIIEARQEHHVPMDKKALVIHSDTLLTLKLERVSYHVTFILLDIITLDPFRWVTIDAGEFSGVTDDEGRAFFTLPSGNVSFAFQRRYYRPEEGILDILSDTVFTFYLVRTHANLRIWVLDGSTPVDRAQVWMGEDTISTTGTGLAVFNELAINRNYLFYAAKEGYLEHEDSLYLESDTAVYISLLTTTSGVKFPANDPWIHCWPNPTSAFLNCRFPPSAAPIPFFIKDVQGKTLLGSQAIGPEITIDVEELPAGIYLLVPANRGDLRPVPFIKQVP